MFSKASKNRQTQRLEEEAQLFFSKAEKSMASLEGAIKNYRQWRFERMQAERTAAASKMHLYLKEYNAIKLVEGVLERATGSYANASERLDPESAAGVTIKNKQEAVSSMRAYFDKVKIRAIDTIKILPKRMEFLEKFEKWREQMTKIFDEMAGYVSSSDKIKKNYLAIKTKTLKLNPEKLKFLSPDNLENVLSKMENFLEIAKANLETLKNKKVQNLNVPSSTRINLSFIAFAIEEEEEIKKENEKEKRELRVDSGQVYCRSKFYGY